MRLQGEAATAGGQLHVVLGNHEAMNLLGDLRYVDPGRVRQFRGRRVRRRARGTAQGLGSRAGPRLRGRVRPEVSARLLRSPRGARSQGQVRTMAALAAGGDHGERHAVHACGPVERAARDEPAGSEPALSHGADRLPRPRRSARAGRAAAARRRIPRPPEAGPRTPRGADGGRGDERRRRGRRTHRRRAAVRSRGRQRPAVRGRAQLVSRRCVVQRSRRVRRAAAAAAAVRRRTARGRPHAHPRPARGLALRWPGRETGRGHEPRGVQGTRGGVVHRGHPASASAMPANRRRCRSSRRACSWHRTNSTMRACSRHCATAT